MTALREYAEHWFAHTALRIDRPNGLTLSAQWIGQVTGARPGFDAELRQIALAALNGSQRELVHRGLAALAVIGGPEDVDAIQALVKNPDPYIAGAASTARFEIAHRAA